MQPAKSECPKPEGCTFPPLTINAGTVYVQYICNAEKDKPKAEEKDVK